MKKRSSLCLFLFAVTLTSCFGGKDSGTGESAKSASPSEKTEPVKEKTVYDAPELKTATTENVTVELPKDSEPRKKRGGVVATPADPSSTNAPAWSSGK